MLKNPLPKQQRRKHEKNRIRQKYQAVQNMAKRIIKQNPKINYSEARQTAEKIANRHDSKKK